METVFRIPFKNCLRLGLGVAKYVALILGIVIGIDILVKGITLNKTQFAIILISIASLGAIIILSLLVFIIMRFYPVIIDSEGIASSTYTGRIKKFTWEEMETVSITSLYSIPYLIINSSNDTSIWIPEILDDQQRFQSLVLEFSRRENPKFFAFFSALLKTREAFD